MIKLITDSVHGKKSLTWGTMGVEAKSLEYYDNWKNTVNAIR